MKYLDFSGLKLNHIRIFLAVAEYNSFTIAAEKLHMTQPFVSKSIQHLEEEMGLYLFVRGNRKFQITPAGRRLCQEWKVMMQCFENSVTSAHAIQTGKNDTFHIGVGQLDVKNSVIIQKLKKTKEQMPALTIYAESNDMSTLVDLLIKGEVDLIVISGHMLPVVEKMNLKWKTLLKSNLAVYIPDSNPLFARQRITFSDLKQERFIVFSSEKDDSYMKLLLQLANEAGFIPMISCYVPNENSFKINLELGNGIVLADTASELRNEHIKEFPLDVRNDLIAVWKPGNDSEGIQSFLAWF